MSVGPSVWLQSCPLSVLLPAIPPLLSQHFSLFECAVLFHYPMPLWFTTTTTSFINFPPPPHRQWRDEGWLPVPALPGRDAGGKHCVPLQAQTGPRGSVSAALHMLAGRHSLPALLPLPGLRKAPPQNYTILHPCDASSRPTASSSATAASRRTTW